MRGWLAVVVRRLCLNRFRSAYMRRESAVGTTPPEGMAAASGRAPATALDPADRTTLDDQVRQALTLVLDRLTPAERTAFVLHDVFGFPHASVAEIVGRTPTAVADSSPAAPAGRSESDGAVGRDTTTPAEHQMVADRFIAACAGGDLSALMAVLDPDVVGEAVLLGHGPILELSGRQRVATRILNLFGPGTDTVMVPIGVASPTRASSASPTGESPPSSVCTSGRGSSTPSTPTSSRPADTGVSRDGPPAHPGRDAAAPLGGRLPIGVAVAQGQRRLASSVQASRNAIDATDRGAKAPTGARSTPMRSTTLAAGTVAERVAGHWRAISSTSCLCSFLRRSTMEMIGTTAGEVARPSRNTLS